MLIRVSLDGFSPCVNSTDMAIVLPDHIILWEHLCIHGPSVTQVPLCSTCLQYDFTADETDSGEVKGLVQFPQLVLMTWEV